MRAVQAIACQSCGSIRSGKVVTFKLSGGTYSMWICLICGPGPLSTLRDWVRKRYGIDLTERVAEETEAMLSGGAKR